MQTILNHHSLHVFNAIFNIYMIQFMIIVHSISGQLYDEVDEEVIANDIVVIHCTFNFEMIKIACKTWPSTHTTSSDSTEIQKEICTSGWCEST